MAVAGSGQWTSAHVRTSHSCSASASRAAGGQVPVLARLLLRGRNPARRSHPGKALASKGSQRRYLRSPRFQVVPRSDDNQINRLVVVHLNVAHVGECSHNCFLRIERGLVSPGDLAADDVTRHWSILQRRVRGAEVDLHVRELTTQADSEIFCPCAAGCLEDDVDIGLLRWRNARGSRS